MPERHKKRDRFILEPDDIEITGSRTPTPEDLKEADTVFNRLLTKKRPKH